MDTIHRLNKTKNKLRVDLEDTTGKTAYAEYDMFAVTSEKTKYQLSLGKYSLLGTVKINALARLYMLFELPFFTSLSSVQFLIRQISTKKSKTVIDFLAHLVQARWLIFSLLEGFFFLLTVRSLELSLFFFFFFFSFWKQQISLTSLFSRELQVILFLVIVVTHSRLKTETTIACLSTVL